MKMNEHDTVCILVSSATGHCALATTSIHGTIGRVTKKAVRVDNETGHCWFPKRALVKRWRGTDCTHATVAGWFPLTRWHWRMASEPSVIAS